MRKRNLVASVVIGVLFLFVAFAHAAEFRLRDELGDEIYLTEGSSYTGWFDFNTVMPSDGSYNYPWDVNWFTVAIDFRDDDDGLEITGRGGTFGWQGPYGTRPVLYKSVEITELTDPVEVVEVEFLHDGSLVSGSSPMTTSYASTNTVWTDERPVWTQYHLREEETLIIYSGSWTLEQNFATPAADAFANGVLGYTVTAIQGDLIFDHARLTADITPNPHAAPLPTSMWLLGTGLAGLVGFRKKFQKA